MYNFLIREAWTTTLIVLLYCILSYRVARHRVLARLIIPFLISLRLNAVFYVCRSQVDFVRFVSDTLYDWLAPIGIFRAAMLLRERRNVKNGGGQ